MLGLIVCSIACGTAILVGCVYPYVAFLIYVAFAIIKPSEMWFWSLSGVNLSAIAAAGLILGWIMRAFGDWQLNRGWLPILCLLAFWGWAWISWCHTSSTALPPDFRQVMQIPVVDYEDTALQTLLTLGKIIIPCFIGATLLDTPRKVWGLLWTIVLSQGYICWEMNLAYVLRGYNRIHEEGLGGFDNNCIAVALVSLTIPSWLLAIHASRPILRYLAIVLGLLHLHTILLSFSRGGMIALTLSLITACLVIRGGWKKYFALSLLTFLAFYFAGPEVRERFTTIFHERASLDSSAKSRLELWRDCLDVIAQFPVLGVGPDNWPAIAPAYGWPFGKEAHTLWLQVGAELGIPGLAFLFGYYLITCIRLYARHFQILYLQLVRDSVLVGIAGFMVAAQFVSIELLETPYYLALCGVGALRFASKSFPQRDMPDATA